MPILTRPRRKVKKGGHVGNSVFRQKTFIAERSVGGLTSSWMGFNNWLNKGEQG